MNEPKDTDAEQRFFSIGCSSCGGIIMGRPLNGGAEVIPVFPSEVLAALALTSMKDTAHPPKVIEIAVRIV